MPDSPFRPIPDDAPTLIRSLDRVARGHPLERKIIVASARGAGRELLRTLARMRGGWVGFVVETPRPLALQIAMVQLARERLRVLDEFEEEALVDEALAAAVSLGGRGSTYGILAGGSGFRRAVRGAVIGLRLAGVTAAQVRTTRFQDRDKQEMLAAVLEGFERGLGDRRGADIAAVLQLATEALRGGEPLPCERIYLLPELTRRGIGGAFVQALLDRGAEALDTDPVVGLPVPEGLLWSAGPVQTTLSYLSTPRALQAEASGAVLLGPTETHPPDPITDDHSDLPLFRAAPSPPVSGPTISLFRAAGIHEEMREVLRRVVSQGRRLDEVEVITPDPAVYGPALHALSRRLGIGVTFAVGLPVERTRPGRAVTAYLRWVGDDFPSLVLRRLLENDDLRAPGKHRRVNPRRLARVLRRLRIGWGRERYGQLLDAALERLDHGHGGPHRHESPERSGKWRAREREELEALRALLDYLLRATPTEIPRRVDLSPRPVAPAALALGLGQFLRLVPTARGSVDDTAKERLLRVLDRIQHTLIRPGSFGSSLGVLEEHLEIRVPAPRAEGKAPWLADGGSVHLTDLEHGGLSGRPLTFLVGMDAGSFPGSDVQDPLLLDQERMLLSDQLPTSRLRMEERQFRFAALFARLRGSVFLSYPAWEAVEGRSRSPSPLLLQAHRLATGDPEAGFDELRSHLGTPASRVPRRGEVLDREDVWLEALAKDDHLLEGVDVVRAAFPRLDAGLRAQEAWEDGEPGPHHGLLPPRPGFDPRADSGAVLSASRLETLGACPLRYFYRYVLRLWPPDDPEYEPDRWLNPMDRGKLLHRVYELWLRAARDRSVEPEDESFPALGTLILQEEAGRVRAEVPPPSEAVYERELATLEEDVHCFANHLSHNPAPWRHLERSFGMPGREDPPVEIEIGPGIVRLRGAVDRVDEPLGEDQPLRVIDYKTGWSGGKWSARTLVYDGGRRLQHVLYTLAIEALEGRPVDAMEYHFPTRRGEGVIRRFARDELKDGPEVAALLLELTRRGHFIPSNDESDCRYCDYRDVCRVRDNEWGDDSSRAARWGKKQMGGDSDAYAELRKVRSWEG